MSEDGATHAAGRAFPSRRRSPRRGPSAPHVAWSVFLGSLAGCAVLSLWPLCFLATFLPLFPNRTGLENLRVRFGSTPLRARFLMSLVYAHYLAYVAETFVLSPLRASVVLNEREAWKVVERAVEQAPGGTGKLRGVAFLGAHLGEIETLGSMLARIVRGLGLPRFRALAKPADSPVVTWILKTVRAWRGVECLWTDRRDLLRELVRACAAGESFGFLVDQKPKAGGLFLRFFGTPAAFPAGGLDVCLRAGMPVVHSCIRRVLPGVFLCELQSGFDAGPKRGMEEMIVHDPTARGGKVSRVAQVMAAYAYWLEGLIRAYPAQWCWDYRKWSRLPPP